MSLFSVFFKEVDKEWVFDSENLSSQVTGFHIVQKIEIYFAYLWG